MNNNWNAKVYFRERESLRMKFHFLSPQNSSDLSEISNKLDRAQKQLRELRDDNSKMSRDLQIIVKGIALMVSAPENDSNEELEAR